LFSNHPAVRTERARLGDAWVETGLIFTSDIGTMLDPDNVSRLTHE
jgi:hypothetical protein